MMPYWPDVQGAPQNTIIGGATLWVLRDRPRAEYNGVAKFFAYLSKPEVQAAWHQNTGYLPITRAAFELTRAQGFYDRNPGAAISIEQMTLKPPTENSKGLRLGSFVLIRDVIEDELEQAFSGKKSAQAALDAAVERGNRLLRQFERANPGPVSRAPVSPKKGRPEFCIIIGKSPLCMQHLAGRDCSAPSSIIRKLNQALKGVLSFR